MTQTSDDDRLLIEAAQADPARFLEVYERYVDRNYAFVSRRTGNRAAAEDITSQVFEQALAAMGGFEWRECRWRPGCFASRRTRSRITGARARDAQGLPPDAPDAREAEDIERRIGLYQHVDRLPDRQRCDLAHGAV